MEFGKDGRPIEPDVWLEGRKAFHVSPFLPIEGGYRFRFRLDDEYAHVDVNYHDADVLMLATSVGGRPEALDDRAVVDLGPVGGVARAEALGSASALLHLINFEEPFGLSVVEALACGTPVIASNRGSMPELIDHGVTGFLVDSVAASRRGDRCARYSASQT